MSYDKSQDMSINGLGQDFMLWDLKKLSEYLNVKTSTLYAWVSKGEIPFIKIHGLIRFHPNEIETWLMSFRSEKSPSEAYPSSKRSISEGIDPLIARAKRKAYNTHHGKPDQDRAEKGGK